MAHIRCRFGYSFWGELLATQVANVRRRRFFSVPRLPLDVDPISVLRPVVANSFASDRLHRGRDTFGAPNMSAPNPADGNGEFAIAFIGLITGTTMSNQAVRARSSRASLVFR